MPVITQTPRCIYDSFLRISANGDGKLTEVVKLS